MRRGLHAFIQTEKNYQKIIFKKIVQKKKNCVCWGLLVSHVGVPVSAEVRSKEGQRVQKKKN